MQLVSTSVSKFVQILTVLTSAAAYRDISLPRMRNHVMVNK